MCADADQKDNALTNPLAAMALDKLTETRDRPLFAPDRRRAMMPVAVTRSAPPPPPPPEPPKLSLFGTVVDEDGPRALVRADLAGKIIRLRIGDEVGGWRVTEIAQQRVVIALDDRTVAVTMFASRRSARGAIARQ